MTRLLPLPEEIRSRPFAVPEAAVAGVPAGRLFARDMHRPSRGIRVPRSCGPDLPALVRSHTALGADVFASLVTAAEIHGVPLPPWAEFRPDDGGPVTAVVEPVPWGKKSGPHFREPGRFLHLARENGGTLPRRRGIAGHRLKVREGDLVEIDGLRLTSVARTWVDLGSVLPIDDLVVAGDAIVSEHARHFGPPKIAMVPLAELRAFVDGARAIHGVRKARLALDLLRVGVDSPPESKLRLLLDDAGLPEFTPNCRVDDVLNRPVWTDLGCPRFRTCIEYEGRHHLTPEQQALDAYRDQRVTDAGWRQVKINCVDMGHGRDWVVSRVRQALGKQGWQR
ncbi:endonuclease domain-containing protein [Arthrobacter sp. NPDC056691]|uniref:endonuclease domain-containing protein n=1 Tax=Arthrobacter sp. NPDC056691 TaxID=3345913 RepID=UPI003672E283